MSVLQSVRWRRTGRCCSSRLQDCFRIDGNPEIMANVAIRPNAVTGNQVALRLRFVTKTGSTPGSKSAVTKSSAPFISHGLGMKANLPLSSENSQVLSVGIAL